MLVGKVEDMRYRYDELEVELRRVGFRTEMSTFDLEAENYMVVAVKVYTTGSQSLPGPRGCSQEACTVSSAMRVCFRAQP